MYLPLYFEMLTRVVVTIFSKFRELLPELFQITLYKPTLSEHLLNETGVTKERLAHVTDAVGESCLRKDIVQLSYVHARLPAKGVLKDFMNNGQRD